MRLRPLSINGGQWVIGRENAATFLVFVDPISRDGVFEHGVGHRHAVCALERAIWSGCRRAVHRCIQRVCGRLCGAQRVARGNRCPWVLQRRDVVRKPTCAGGHGGRARRFGRRLDRCGQFFGHGVIGSRIGSGGDACGTGCGVCGGWVGGIGCARRGARDIASCR